METITAVNESQELEAAGFRWLERGSVRALACRALESEGFANAFSTRAGGVSAFPRDALNLAGFNEDAAENIYENRRRFLSLLDGRWSLAACWQVHGSDVRVVRGEEETKAGGVGEQERCDALTTDAAGVLVGVKTADCVPVIIGDPGSGACAAVHAGWRGTLAEIVVRALETLRREYGTRAGDVRACIGPAARGCCYEVGPEVVSAFREKFSRAADWFTPTRDGHALADLQRANREQLNAAGVPAERVHTLPLCTMCRTDLFFSYRRDKKLHGRTGRLLSVIGRQNEIVNRES
jgi:YfiH family protein